MNLSAIVKPCSKKKVINNNIFCVYDENEVDNFSSKFLDGEYWQAQNAVIGTAQGRGVTWFIHHENKDWVLRHYYRGGMIGKFNNDHYIYTGIDKTRAAIEFELLNHMRTLALPVPKPIAYRVIKKGMFYQADLLTERVCNAQDLISLLGKQPISIELWGEIGSTIKKFHQHNIYHHDLNIHNILIDQDEKVWIIDFDRGELKLNSDNWKQENMDRLLRSFRKEKGKLANLYWKSSDWNVLIEAYSNDSVR